MLRDYNDGTHNDVGVFSGIEIEHTPAYGKQTLFLARNDLNYDQIIDLCTQVKAEAVYYGANRSFMPNIATHIGQIIKLLEAGYYVTIDYQYSIHEQVKKFYSSVWNKDKFIPFCSIIFANSGNDNNLCFKIDDIDFNKTNPGVWTMSMNNFKQTSGYTKWDEYKQDEPITIKNYANTEKKAI